MLQFWEVYVSVLLSVEYVHRVNSYSSLRHTDNTQGGRYYNRWVVVCCSLAFPNENAPIGLHSSMFLPTLENQLNPEQKAKWLQKAKAHEVIGTYAQTEMGHGELGESYFADVTLLSCDSPD